SKRVYENAQRVICVSDRVRREVLQGAPGAGTSVVYNGVDVSKFRVGTAPHQNPTILSVGNLIPTKGHELLVRAFAAIAHRYPAVSLDIIGDGCERTQLQALAAKLKVPERLRFLGRQARTSVAEAMRRCTIFALPSEYEGLGCVYLEAMSSGKPVIACRGQGIAEVIDHGRNGWLVAPNDLGALIHALARLLTDAKLRSTLGCEARKTIIENFS